MLMRNYQYMNRPASIGDVVRRMRQNRGLTQRDINQRSAGRIKTSWLASLETGRITNPPQEKLSTLASLLGTSVLDIYQEAGVVEFPTPSGASADEQVLIEEFRKLPPSLKRAALAIVRDLNSAQTIDEVNGHPELQPASQEQESPESLA